MASICGVMVEVLFSCCSTPRWEAAVGVSVWWVARVNPLTLAQQIAVDHCRMEKSIIQDTGSLAGVDLSAEE